MLLVDLHRTLGAHLAPDNIPLHYGNPAQEYAQAHHASLLDRSHEGRLILTGKTRFDLLNRMSTNKTIDMPLNTGVGTIFTNPNARIIERAEVYHLGEQLLVLYNPSRRDSFREYLQRNIFFSDDVNISDIQPSTHQFALHGQEADAIVAQIAPEVAPSPLYGVISTHVDEKPITLIKRKPVVGSHWAILVEQAHATSVFEKLLALGKPQGLTPVGSLTYNVLRIQYGQPAINELNDDYLPLELGLWDEVSFHKGCYTGQEIIARMDSREKLARVMVSLQLSQMVNSPATLYHNGVAVGRLTSSVQATDGNCFAIGIIKATLAEPNTYIHIGDAHIDAHVQHILGTQPKWVTHK
jgi:folate-binding protein YgfZ